MIHFTTNVKPHHESLSFLLESQIRGNRNKPLISTTWENVCEPETRYHLLFRSTTDKFFLINFQTLIACTCLWRLFNTPKSLKIIVNGKKNVLWRLLQNGSFLKFYLKKYFLFKLFAQTRFATETFQVLKITKRIKITYKLYYCCRSRMWVVLWVGFLHNFVTI